MVRLLVFMAAISASFFGIAKTSASVDQYQVLYGLSFELTIETDKDINGSQFDLRPLDVHFEKSIIRGPNKGYYRDSSGRRETSTSITVLLKPKEIGTLQIPSLNVGNEQTDPIYIKVVENAGTQNDTAKLELAVDFNSVYQDQTFIVSLKFFSSYRNVSATMPVLDIPGAKITNIDGLREDQVSIDQNDFFVTERLFLVEFSEAGNKTIPSVNMAGNYRRHSRAIKEPFSVKSDPITIEVKPIPNNYPKDALWLPLFKLQADLNVDRRVIKLGETITVEKKLTANGFDADLLPTPEEYNIDGLRVYPEKAKHEFNVNNGTLTQSMAIVPSEIGEFQLPQVKIPWWNIITDQLEYVQFDQTTINVLAGDVTEEIFEQPAQETIIEVKRGIWPWLTALFFMAWMITGFLYWRQLKLAKPITTQTLDKAPSNKQSIKQSLSQKDFANTIKLLKDEIKQAGYPDLEQFFSDHIRYKAQFEKLNAHLYNPNNEHGFDANAFWQFYQKHPIRKTVSTSSPLTLYPS